MREFCNHFYNEKWYRQNPASKLYLDHEGNRDIGPGPYFADAVQLCLKTDICKTMGLTLGDLMNMDRATYEYVRDTVNKDNEAKSRELEKSQRELEHRQNQLAETKRNANQRR